MISKVIAAAALSAAVAFPASAQTTGPYVVQQLITMGNGSSMFIPQALAGVSYSGQIYGAGASFIGPSVLVNPGTLQNLPAATKWVAYGTYFQIKDWPSSTVLMPFLGNADVGGRSSIFSEVLPPTTPGGNGTLVLAVANPNTNQESAWLWPDLIPVGDKDGNGKLVWHGLNVFMDPDSQGHWTAYAVMFDKNHGYLPQNTVQGLSLIHI